MRRSAARQCIAVWFDCSLYANLLSSSPVYCLSTFPLPPICWHSEICFTLNNGSFILLLDILKCIILLINQFFLKAIWPRAAEVEFLFSGFRSLMRRAKWVWRLPECSIIVMRHRSSEQLKMPELCLCWDTSQIIGVSPQQTIQEWQPHIGHLSPSTPHCPALRHLSRKSQGRHHTRCFDQVITPCQSIWGEAKTTCQSRQRVWPASPSSSSSSRPSLT